MTRTKVSTVILIALFILAILSAPFATAVAQPSIAVRLPWDNANQFSASPGPAAATYILSCEGCSGGGSGPQQETTSLNHKLLD